MIWSFEALRGAALRATNGSIGAVDDMLIDDQSWAVRYLVADTSQWLSGRKVLIIPSLLGEPDPGGQAFPIDLTKEQITNSPDIDTDPPISRQVEADLHGYYGWTPYWSGTMVAAPTVIGGTAYSDHSAVAPERRGPETDGTDHDTGHGDPHLRSARAIEGYHISAFGGAVGHVHTVLVDSDGWSITGIVIDTRNWLPGKTVALSPKSVRSIDWANREVTFDLTRDQIKDSPAYEPVSG